MTGERSPNPAAVESESVSLLEGSEEDGSLLGWWIFRVFLLNFLLGLFVYWDRSYAAVLVAVFVAPVLNAILFGFGITGLTRDGREPGNPLRQKMAFVGASGGAVGLFYLFFSSIELVGC